MKTIKTIFLSTACLFWSHIFAIEPLDKTKDTFDPNIYRQAGEYNPKLQESFYCTKVPYAAYLQFLEIYRNRPIQVNISGMRSHGNFFLWYFLQQIKPALIIESGVLRGQSTWMIEQSAPQAEIISIDPDLGQRFYISSKVKYTTEDFSTLEIPKVSGPVVAFFDDHINDFERVLQCHNKGIKYLIFDDNYSALRPSECWHITLTNCFEIPEFSDKGEILKKLIKHYYIMPQIIGKSSNHPVHHRIRTNIPAIWPNLSDVDPSIRDAMHIFASDSPEYRWITFVELY